MTVYEEIQLLCENARDAAVKLALASTQTKNSLLLRIAEDISANAQEIIEANALDMAFAKENGIAASMLDRLKLTDARIESIASSIRDISRE